MNYTGTGRSFYAHAYVNTSYNYPACRLAACTCSLFTCRQIVFCRHNIRSQSAASGERSILRERERCVVRFAIAFPSRAPPRVRARPVTRSKWNRRSAKRFIVGITDNFSFPLASPLVCPTIACKMSISFTSPVYVIPPERVD